MPAQPGVLAQAAQGGEPVVEEGLQRGPDALGPAYREDEEEDEEEEEQTDPKKPTTDEVRPASGMRGQWHAFTSQVG